MHTGATYILRYEAFILAAECATLEAATWLVNTARYAANTHTPSNPLPFYCRAAEINPSMHM